MILVKVILKITSQIQHSFSHCLFNEGWLKLQSSRRYEESSAGLMLQVWFLVYWAFWLWDIDTQIIWIKCNNCMFVVDEKLKVEVRNLFDTTS